MPLRSLPSLNPRSFQAPALLHPPPRSTADSGKGREGSRGRDTRRKRRSRARANAYLGRGLRDPATAMAPLRFAANLSWLFSEQGPALSARLDAAARAGFKVAEVAWPYAEPAAQLAAAAQAAGVRLVLLNTPPGATDLGELGLGAVPGRQDAFREGLELAVAYARELGCPQVHLMAGRIPKGAERSAVARDMEAVFMENLRHAADVLARENLVGLVEPINSRLTDPLYFLDTPEQAAAILRQVDRPNLRLQLDVFHWQIMGGNLTANIRAFLPLIGHVQVAQVPDRGEPDSPGELNFPYLFQLLEELGYTGYVGCEYRPRGDTNEGLGWLRTYWESRGGQR